MVSVVGSSSMDENLSLQGSMAPERYPERTWRSENGVFCMPVHEKIVKRLINPLADYVVPNKDTGEQAAHLHATLASPSYKGSERGNSFFWVGADRKRAAETRDSARQIQEDSGGLTEGYNILYAKEGRYAPGDVPV